MSIIDTHLADLAALSRDGTDDAFAAKVAEATDSIASGAPTTEAQRRRLLTTVRGRRAFAPLAKLCEALTWAGHDTAVVTDGKGGAMRNPAYDPRVRQEMVQAMVDQGQLIQALDVVDQHRRRIESLGTGDGPPADGGLAQAWGQACGLAGRIHKQIYVDNAERDTRANFEEHLRHAICWYGLPFRRVEGDRIRCDETRDDEWHAINFVALLHRAERDGIAIPGESAKARAAELVAALKGKIGRLGVSNLVPGAWTFASLGEASIARGDWTGATAAYEAYLAHPHVDLFAAFGSLRQLVEVWSLDGNEGDGAAGRIIETACRGVARLMAGTKGGLVAEDRGSGCFQLFAVDTDSGKRTPFEVGKKSIEALAKFEIKSREGQSATGQPFSIMPTTGDPVADGWRLLLKDPNSGQDLVVKSRSADVLQRAASGIAGPMYMKSVHLSAELGRAVGRVYNDDNDATVGTGFLVRGDDLVEGIDPILLFVTNAHVLSASSDGVTLRNARIEFSHWVDRRPQRWVAKPTAIIWESPIALHDVCVAVVSSLPDWVMHATIAAPDSLPARHKDIAPTEQMCSVVGFAGDAASRIVHPNGLRILDIGPFHPTDPRAPECLHYTNLTAKGDSGGPVCNAAWEVIAIHRAGASSETKLQALNGARGHVDHAEGVMFRSVRRAMERDRDVISLRLAECVTPIDAERESPVSLPAATSAAAADLIALLTTQTAPTKEVVEAAIENALIRPDDEAEPSVLPPMGPDIRLMENTRQRSAAAGVLDSGVVLASRLNRRARNTLYEQRAAQGEDALRLVSDGDSWFQYPWPGVEDTIDQLINRYGYLVGCDALAGETLQMRVAESEIVNRIKYVKPDAILISGGGNDMLGNGAIQTLLRPYERGMVAGDVIDSGLLDDSINTLVGLHKQWITRIRRVEAYAPIFAHGYDWAVPKRKRGWWLDLPLRRHGITDGRLQREIVRYVIDRFSERMQAMAREADNVHFVDCRGAVGTGSHWMDELHPTNDGFARVAACFHAAIENVLGPTKAATEGGISFVSKPAR